MSKKGTLILLLAALALILAGCGLRSPEELYALPKPSAEYESLQASLEQLRANGYEYTAPASGDNTQSVQLEDLDGDGEDEAIAFFRDSSGEERPLKICIFHSDGEGGYELSAMIEGDGDMVNSVVYCQLNATQTKEIVVGWRISSTVYALSAYSIENNNVIELMSAPSYTRYTVQDLDQDNQAEIVLFQMGAAEEGGNTASYYDWTEDTMMAINTIPLSVSMESLESVRYNYLVNSYPALYVNGYRKDNYSTVITDILAVRDGMLANITMSDSAGDSGTEHLSLIALKDINSDNVLELPQIKNLNSSASVEYSESFYVVKWVQYDLKGRESSVGYTYHNAADGWYLNVPTTWVRHLILGRSDVNVGATVERSITFYYQSRQTSEPQPFLTIYRNSGSNRASRATMGERFLLGEDAEAVYSAEFYDSNWDCGMDAKELAQCFHLILTDWSAD